MNRSKRVISSVAASAMAILLVSSAALAFPGFGPGRPGMMMRRMGTPMLGQLQLSGDQQTQIKSIFASGRETIQPLALQLREKHSALREAAHAQPFDETVVRSQAQEIADLQAQLMVARAQMMNQILTVLTDEQKTRRSELGAERLQQFREWRKQQFGKPEQS